MNANGNDTGIPNHTPYPWPGRNPNIAVERIRRFSWPPIYRRTLSQPPLAAFGVEPRLVTSSHSPLTPHDDATSSSSGNGRPTLPPQTQQLVDAAGGNLNSETKPQQDADQDTPKKGTRTSQSATVSMSFRTPSPTAFSAAPSSEPDMMHDHAEGSQGSDELKETMTGEAPTQEAHLNAQGTQKTSVNHSQGVTEDVAGNNLPPLNSQVHSTSPSGGTINITILPPSRPPSVEDDTYQAHGFLEPLVESLTYPPGFVPMTFTPSPRAALPPFSPADTERLPPTPKLHSLTLMAGETPGPRHSRLSSDSSSSSGSSSDWSSELSFRQRLGQITMNNTYTNAVPNWAQTHPQNRLRPGDPQGFGVRFESPTSASSPIYYAPFPPQIPIPESLPPGFVSQTFAPNNHHHSPGLPIPATSARAKYRNWYRTLRTIAFGIFTFILHSIPQQVYLHILLRVPLLYRSRVDRIFEEARLSEPEIKRMARATAHLWNTNSTAFNRGAHFFSPFMGIASMPKSPNQIPMTSKIQQALPAEISQFRSTWEGFVDSLMQEWHTLNIVSVLLLSAILTMLQIDGAANPITRTSALFSLLCALMSLLYGCMYIIRFATMRKLHRASGFAKEAEKDASSPWWNIGILLAMPAIWLAWSIILFLICIMSFVWLNGSTQNPIVGDLSPLAALGPRIGLTVIFFLGLTYFVLIVKTFYRYGAALDREWARTLADWAKAPPGMGTPGSFEKDTTAWGPRLIPRGDGRNIYWAGSGPAPSG